jgi:hypothetical protein
LSLRETEQNHEQIYSIPWRVQLLSNSGLDAAGKLAELLIFGASLPIAGMWNQCFVVAQLNLPAVSSPELLNGAEHRHGTGYSE